MLHTHTAIQTRENGIDSIRSCLANAVEVARSLDARLAADLQCLLRMAACEADRIRKAAKKPAAKTSAKGAAKGSATTASAAASKKPAKRAAKAQVKVAPVAKTRRRAATLNGTMW
jgi:hypothetical protein